MISIPQSRTFPRLHHQVLLLFALLFASSHVFAQSIVLEQSIAFPTKSIPKGHTIQAVHTGKLDSAQVHISLSTSFTRGQNDQSVESTRFFSRFNSVELRCDSIEQINNLIFKALGTKVYPAGMAVLPEQVAYIFTQYDDKKNTFSLYVVGVSKQERVSEINVQKFFEAIVANPNQISYRMTQSGAHLGLVFMQLEDKENHRATLQWQIYDGNLKSVYQRSEKLNFGGGSVGLLDFSISPELVCLTTVKHVNSKTVQDAIDYYVVSQERTSVYQGMALALRNRDASGTWVRYNRDSACFELGGLTAPSSKRIPEHAFHYRIPLHRVDLIRGSRFELPAKWVRAWKNDTRDFAFRYFRMPSTTYKFDPNKKGTLAVVYGFEGGYLGKPFQSDLLVVETSPTGLLDSARMERNLVVDKVNSGFGFLNSKSLGTVLISAGFPTPESGRKMPNNASGPRLLQVSPAKNFNPIQIPEPSDNNGFYFYEGIEQISEDRFILPYRTPKGLSIAVYRIKT
jgi:hypothetical protein